MAAAFKNIIQPKYSIRWISYTTSPPDTKRTVGRLRARRGRDIDNIKFSSLNHMIISFMYEPFTPTAPIPWRKMCCLYLGKPWSGMRGLRPTWPKMFNLL